MSQKIEIDGEKIVFTDEVETVYEADVKSHGNSARPHVPREFIGQRALVIILNG